MQMLLRGTVGKELSGNSSLHIQTFVHRFGDRNGSLVPGRTVAPSTYKETAIGGLLFGHGLANEVSGIRRVGGFSPFPAKEGISGQAGGEWKEFNAEFTCPAIVKLYYQRRQWRRQPVTGVLYLAVVPDAPVLSLALAGSGEPGAALTSINYVGRMHVLTRDQALMYGVEFGPYAGAVKEVGECPWLTVQEVSAGRRLPTVVRETVPVLIDEPDRTSTASVPQERHIIRRPRVRQID